MTKRAVLYARVSGDDTRNEGRNLAGQLAMCREHALKKGWRVVEELAEDDRGASGALLSLPQLDRLRQMAQNSAIDVIVVREIDRFSRTLAKQLIIEAEMKRHGVSIEYVLGEYPDTPEGNLNKNLKAVIAEYERVKIAERMSRGKRLKVQTGHVMVHGHRPYGYHIVDDNGRRTLTIHEPEAQIVRLVYQWYTKGDGENGPLSIKGIVAKLSSLKIPTYADLDAKSPAKKRRPVGVWAQSSVRNMLTQETYAGVWHYGKRNRLNKHWVKHPEESWIRIEVPAIVPRDVWEAVQERRKENFKPGRAPRHECLLRRRLFCTECGCRIQTDERRSSSPRWPSLYIYYVCKARKLYATDCSQRLSYRADVVDQLAWDWVRLILSNPDDLRTNLAEYQEAQRQGAQSKLERLEVITALVQEHSTKLQRLVDLYIDGSIDKETWLERKLRLEDAIAGLRAEQNTIRVEVDAQLIGDDTIAALQAFTANIAEGLDMAETRFIHKRAIIEQLGVTGKIAVENGEKVLHLHCYVDEATFSLKTSSIINAGSHGTSSCCTAARTTCPAV